MLFASAVVVFCWAAFAQGDDGVQIADIGDGNGGMDFVEVRQFTFSQLKPDFNFKPPGAGGANPPNKKKSRKSPAVAKESPPEAAPVTESLPVKNSPEAPVESHEERRVPVNIVDPESTSEAATVIETPSTSKSRKSHATATPTPSVMSKSTKRPDSISVLKPGTILQLPAGVQPRSMALAPRRRAVIVTDETVGAHY